MHCQRRHRAVDKNRRRNKSDSEQSQRAQIPLTNGDPYSAAEQRQAENEFEQGKRFRKSRDNKLGTQKKKKRRSRAK